jgi:tetratricopeptide (TPR) repeat protein
VMRLEQLAATHPNEPLLYRRLAEGYTALERPQAALEALEQAYRLDPASLLIRRELALAHANLGTNDPALWRALGLDAATLLALGDQYLHAGNPDALKWYRAAASLEPGWDLSEQLRQAQGLQ